MSYELRGTGVTSTVLCPGPTATEFADTAGVGGSRLFAMGTTSADKVAAIGYKGIQRGRARVIPGWRNRLTVASLRTAPRPMTVSIAVLLNGSKHGV